jgi:ketosteroid isomerase-like protein
MQTDDIVSTITTKWAAAFTRLDSATLSSLYSRNAFFFGSNPNLYRGTDGVKAYFDGLPRWAAPTVAFTDVRSALVASDLINMAGIATFLIEQGAVPLAVKITWGIVREDGDWKIVSHHVSPLTPLI